MRLSLPCGFSSLLQRLQALCLCRVRRLYLGKQRAPAAGVGELNYDTYQVGTRETNWHIVLGLLNGRSQQVSCLFATP